MKKKDYLIINRSKWRTGTKGKGDSMLLNGSGYMCCLGFRCNQMGIPLKKLKSISCPTHLANEFTIPDLLDEKGNNSKFTNKAIYINDSEFINTKERENKIKKLFKEIDVTVEFIGNYKN